jgi:hypothetical protein
MSSDPVFGPAASARSMISEKRLLLSFVYQHLDVLTESST